MGANRGRETRAGQQRGRTETDSGGEDREGDGWPPPPRYTNRCWFIWPVAKLCLGEQRGTEFGPREDREAKLAVGKVHLYVCLFVLLEEFVVLQYF